MTDSLEAYRRDVERKTGERIQRPPGVKLVTDGEGEPTLADIRRDTAIECAQIIEQRDHSRAIPWAWEQCNQVFGPLVPGRLYVVGARPGNGKTALMLGLLDSLIDSDISTVYLGTEMPPAVLVAKWASARAGIGEEPLNRDEWGSLTELERAALESQVRRLLSSSVVFPPCLRLDRVSLQRWVRWAHEQLDDARRTPRLLVLDHLHRVRPEEGENDRVAIERTIVALADLAIEREMAVVAACQLRRPERPSVFELYTPPTMSMFKGAGAIEENAALALGLYRPLKPDMGKADEQALIRGHKTIIDFALPDTMAVSCVKSRFSGRSLGQLLHLEVRDGTVVDCEEPPTDAGDAWESEGERAPF